MKVLIATLPRSGSKFIQRNMQAYLASLGRTLVANTTDDPAGDIGLNEFFVGRGKNGKFINKATLFKGKVVYVPTDDLDQEGEKENRLSILRTNNQHFVVKDLVIFSDMKVTDQLIDMSDMIIVLKRDLRNCVLSNLASMYTHCYHQSHVMTSAIKEKTIEKIHVDLKLVDDLLERFTMFEAKKWPPEKIKVLNFEDLVKIKSSVEFCKWMKLPFSHFTFVPAEIEFSHHKYTIFSNLEEVMGKIHSYPSH